MNSLFHLLTENFPCSLTLSKYPKQLFAHLPVRLSKNKKPLTMMWTIYILRKVKYQNVFDQMNIELLSSPRVSFLSKWKGGGRGCCKLLDRPTGYTIQQVIAMQVKTSQYERPSRVQFSFISARLLFLSTFLNTISVTTLFFFCVFDGRPWKRWPFILAW